MFSVDNMKQITDTHGEKAWDDVLKILTMRTRNSFKQGTLLARYSDAKFVITLPNAKYETAVKFAGQMQKKIKDTRFETPKGLKIHVSISLAIATKTDTAKTLRDIVVNAEKELSSVQASGSGKVVSTKA